MLKTTTKLGIGLVKLFKKTAKNGCIVDVNKYAFENHHWFLVRVKYMSNLGDNIVRQHYVTDECAALNEANQILALFASGMEFWDYLESCMAINGDLVDEDVGGFGYAV